MSLRFIGLLFLALSAWAQYTPPSGGGGGGAVSSVYGRTGAVTAQSGDYTADKVTNAVDTTQTYSNPGWITALANAKITGLTAFATLATGTSAQFVRGDATVQSLNVAALSDGSHVIVDTSTYSNPAWITALANAKITGLTAFATLATAANTTYVRGDGTTQTRNCASITDAAASCATDATNASNISSGTLNAARLPSTFSIAGPITLTGGGTGTVTMANGTAPSSPASGNQGVFFNSANSNHLSAITSAGVVRDLEAGGGTISQPYFSLGGSTYGPIYLFTQPPTSGWTFANQASSTVDSTNGDLLITWPASGADNLTAYTRTLPSLPVTVVASFIFTPGTAASGQCGFGVDLSDGTKHILFELADFEGQSANPSIRTQRWTNTSTPTSGGTSSASLVSNYSYFNRLITFKVVVDSTNNTFSFSTDGGNHYTQFLQESRTTFLTPSTIGLSWYNHTACQADLLSWTGA